MVLQYDGCISQRGYDEFVVYYELQVLERAKDVRVQGGCIPEALSILQARTWPSSFMCDAERNATNSLRRALKERC